MSINYKGIIWAGIFLEDLEEGIKFYQNTLELKLLNRKEDYAHFDAGNGELLELFSEGKASSAPKSTDIQSTLFALRVDDLNFTVETLKNRDVKFTENTGTFENMRWATLVDPEGNCIEIKEIH